MTKTIGDYLKEAELYEYSREYFEICKTVSEIRLLELYIENQEYINDEDNKVLIESVDTDYLVEADDTDKVEEAKDKVEEKKNWLWDKAKEIWEWIKKTIMAFFNWLGKKWEAIKKKAVDVYNWIRGRGANKKDIQPIVINVIQEVVHKSPMRFIRSTVHDMAAAFFNKELSTTLFETQGFNTIISQDYCPNAIDLKRQLDVFDIQNFDGNNNPFEKIFAENLKNGINVTLYTRPDLEQKKSELYKVFDTMIKQSNYNPEIIASVKKAIPDTITLYTDFIKLIEDILGKLLEAAGFTY